MGGLPISSPSEMGFPQSQDSEKDGSLCGVFGGRSGFGFSALLNADRERKTYLSDRLLALVFPAVGKRGRGLVMSCKTLAA